MGIMAYRSGLGRAMVTVWYRSGPGMLRTCCLWERSRLQREPVLTSR